MVVINPLLLEVQEECLRILLGNVRIVGKTIAGFFTRFGEDEEKYVVTPNSRFDGYVSEVVEGSGLSMMEGSDLLIRCPDCRVNSAKSFETTYYGGRWR